jgi:hypothetical protein
MIGTRSGFAALVATVALVPLLGTAGPDPSATVMARRLVIARAQAADASLAALERQVEPVLEAARTGAAAVISGPDAPGAVLSTAAAELAAVAPAADSARAAVSGLNRVIAARDPGASPAPLPDGGGEVRSIAAQLEGTATAADGFVAMRLRAGRVLDALGRALAALDAGEVADAADMVAEARADHDALAAWEVELVTLPVWLEAAGAMVDAVEAIVAATRAGDAAAAAAAADAFAASSADAVTADRALRIAIGEGGAAVTAAPLGRLAEMLRGVAEARSEVAAILQAVGR